MTPTDLIHTSALATPFDMSDQKPPTDKLQPQTNEKAAEFTGAPDTKKDGEGERKKLPQLGALEDDDEFEVGPSSRAAMFQTLTPLRTFQQLVSLLFRAYRA